MALTQNTALRTTLADAWADVFSGGTLEILTAGLSLLATIALPGPAFSAGVAGVASKTGTWSAVASGSGIASVGRFISADTLKIADVSITESGGGGDMIINDEDVISGGTVTVLTFSYIAPAA